MPCADIYAYQLRLPPIRSDAAPHHQLLPLITAHIHADMGWWHEHAAAARPD